MQFPTLIIGDEPGGYQELLSGSPATAIQKMKRIVAARQFDPETRRGALQYILVYATYSFSSLPLNDVLRLYEELRQNVNDLELLQLIHERIAARICFERAVSSHNQDNIRYCYADGLRQDIQAGPDVMYCVSIPRFADRQRRLFANAIQLGYRRIKFRGVDAADIDRVPDRFEFDAARSTVANTLGHVHIWQEIVDSNLPGALVVEDDAILSGRLQWNRFASQLEKLDIVFFNNRVLPDYRLVPSDFRPDSPECFIMPIDFGCGTEGYYVTRRGAERLLQLFERIVAPIDIQMMSHAREFLTDCDDWRQCRQARNTTIRLDVRRLYPFMADHPPANFSTYTNDFLRGFCPGLWYGDVRMPSSATVK